MLGSQLLTCWFPRKYICPLGRDLYFGIWLAYQGFFQFITDLFQPEFQLGRCVEREIQVDRFFSPFIDMFDWLHDGDSPLIRSLYHLLKPLHNAVDVWLCSGIVHRVLR
jgi:hypothetical protein